MSGKNLIRIHWMLVLCWLWPAWMSAANGSQPVVMVEDLKVSSKKMMVRFEVGTTRRLVEVFQNGREMQVHFTIHIDVDAVVTTYRQETDIWAWYDRRGLVMFVTEVDNNGSITSLSGIRSMRSMDREVMHLFGVVDGNKIDKQMPYSYIQTTSLENFPWIAAQKRMVSTWRVLSLADGEIDVVTAMPEGKVECPGTKERRCEQVDVHSSRRDGKFIYSPDGLLVFAEGEDGMGYFKMIERATGNGTGDAQKLQIVESDSSSESEKKEKQSGGFYRSLFNLGVEAAKPEIDNGSKKREAPK